MTDRLDLAGQRFGRLLVIGYSHSNNGAVWNCQCDCGNTTAVAARHLRSNITKSCGCGAKEQARRNCDRQRKSREVPYPYPRKMKDMYRNMRARCYDPDNNRWKNYGGRGIKVCDEWLNDIRAFYKWVYESGYKPGLTIDRIDVNGDYEPANCRFTTVVVQQNNTTRNRYLTWKSRTMTVAEWAREIGVKPQALQHRVDRGWDIERIFTQPFRATRK